ncbi:glycosyltransferase family 39 protein [Nocardia aurantiaca]|uniref:Phospholipid carrier-dependent glycosyltransferase n=1 Tax=Nocardia aurantiaca TaxID=2675850 RepID=A0A6I3KZ47_9NOCA|nr:glycosyltransferase family 39 protein [Nocardia aurantiaca]MTE14897.1 phospholipid carrier-dependent glycosyltransferase [Nocardia aurantiaca]
MTATLTEPRLAPPPIEPSSTRRREYPALAALLIGTAVAYLWNLSANGWANAFYAAAVQAGSVSWKAMFFGSSDAANSITVDKTPLSLWPMEISVRIFGLHSWSMLLPQALLGVASVALLWAIVRRNFGASAGLLAGLVLALTPIAAVMFRFNNPDAMLVFLMLAAAWAMTRAVADGRWRWVLLTGVFIGLGFLAKQLQVLLVVPALALTYLIAGPPTLGKRIIQLFGAAAAMVAGAGWWVLLAELWPASDRPYFGGSQHNSIIELTLGYNGLGRLDGNERGSVGGFGGGEQLPSGGGGMWGTPGIGRLFEPAQAGQIVWLIPAALVLLLAGIALRGKLARTDPQRATLILFGGWLVGTGLVFSLMKGIFHPYYTVALAPAVAALIGAGSALAWQHRDRLWVRLAAVLAMGLTTATAWIILSRSTSFVPWLRWAILVGGIVATALMLIRLPRKGGLAVAAAAALVGLAGPTAYAVDGIATAHQGPMPSAGPAVRGAWGPGGPHGGDHGMPNGRTGNGGPGNGNAGPGNGIPGGQHGMGMNHGDTANAGPGGNGGNEGGPGGFGGPAGGMMSASNPSAQVTALLKADGSDYTWVAATVSSNAAAGFQLATQLPVMPVGGFNGSDPSPTLAQFQEYVQVGRIHYFISGNQMGGDRGGNGNGESRSQSAQITAWVKEHFSSQEVDGITLYDLTSPKTT